MIYIHTILDKTVGMGNYHRCFSIFEEINRKELPVVFLLKCDASEDLYTNIHSAVQVFFSDKEISDYMTENIENGSIILLDLPVLSLVWIDFYHDLRRKCHCSLVSINDNKADELLPDIYINTDTVKELNFSLPEVYIGLDYQIIRQDLWVKRPNKFQEVNDIKTVSIMFGGSDPGNLTEQMIKKLAQSILPYDFHFVLGNGFSRNRIEKLQNNEYQNIFFHVKPSVPNFFNKSDVLITMGGMATYEALYLGKPVLAVEWDYMAPYVKYLESKKLVKSLGEINSNKFLYTMQSELKQINVLNKIAQNGYRAIDGKGQQRIIEILMDK